MSMYVPVGTRGAVRSRAEGVAVLVQEVMRAGLRYVASGGFWRVRSGSLSLQLATVSCLVWHDQMERGRHRSPEEEDPSG
jgi:hypothetical protein